MFGMGVLYESADKNFLSGFLQRRQGFIGMVITGLDALLNSREDESRLLDFLESLVDSGSNFQAILISNKQLKETRASMIHYPLEAFSQQECLTWMKGKLGRHAEDESILKSVMIEISHPLCLDLMFGIIKMGETDYQQLKEALENDWMDSVVDQITTGTLMSLEKRERK